MVSCKEIFDIVSNPDKENLNIEFKKSDILYTKEGKKKLAHQIVAFANRLGGKILIGILDDGTFEGSNIFDIDIDKGRIINIIQNKISPLVNCDVEFITCKQGDILSINIPKRKDMPYAYIKRTDGGEIISREYLIRTPHGIRHISDRQLQFLFNEQEINFDYLFRFNISFLKNNLKIPFEIKQQTSIERCYASFLHNLPENDIEQILNSDYEDFICLITPYMLLSSFSQYFYESWLVKIKRNNKLKTILNVPKIKISINQLPDLSKNVRFPTLSINFKKYFNDTTFRDFYLPINTHITIKNKRKGRSHLILTNDDFIFKFSYYYNKGGIGIDPSHPQIASFLKGDIKHDQKFYKNFSHMKLSGYYGAEFNFPEKDFDLFDNYYKYALTIRKILENDWDFDNFIEKLPNRVIYSIDNKLNRILKEMQKK